MRMSDAFPSDYLRAGDLRDQSVKVVIADVKMETIGDDHKPVVYFEGKQKGLVLNKTNGSMIATVYGDDTDNWTGGEIEMYPTMVDFQGRSVAAIRVRIPPRKPAARPATPPVAPPPSVAPPRNPLDDDVPFMMDR